MKVSEKFSKVSPLNNSTPFYDSVYSEVLTLSFSKEKGVQALVKTFGNIMWVSVEGIASNERKENGLFIS